MFLVDDRIMALLGRVLGQIFFRKKKQPVPIRLGALAKGDVKGAAQRIIDARNRTYMYRCAPIRCPSCGLGRRGSGGRSRTKMLVALRCSPLQSVLLVCGDRVPATSG